MKKLFLAVLVLMTVTLHLDAQRFGGGVTIGANASQVDGDDLSGYNKIGLNAGANVSYDIGYLFQLNVEFLFSQRGSRSLLIPYKYEPLRHLTINYIELPFYVTLKIAEDKKDFSHFHLYTGFSVARMINADNQLNDVEVDEKKFKKDDFSYLVGVKYFITEKIGLNLRFTNSIVNIYTHPENKAKNIKGYFFSLGGIVKLL